MDGLELSNQDRAIARLILREIDERLRFLDNVGVGYLSMERASATLSGGEAQRIRLATQIGSSLVGVLYILDEPSIGLHQRDNERLIATLERLRDLGNTVLVVEHDEGTMRAADYVVDMGPGAGEHGGHVVAARHRRGGHAGQGVADRAVPVRHAADRAAGRSAASRPATSRSSARRSTTSRTSTSRSRSASSARSRACRARASRRWSTRSSTRPSRTSCTARGCARARTSASRASSTWTRSSRVDQSPIGRTPRSNPATYIGLFDQIRDLYSKTQEARARGYKPGRFSFNVKGGRCEVCRGDGQIKIEMHFLPDIYVPCEQCHGKRYNRETLDIRFKGKTIADVLDMPVEEALEFFAHIPKIHRRLQTLHDVGLDYMRLGQPATTLSGGEAQRIKLASELAKVATGRTLYILDEPTTGLHFADIQKLLEVLQRLVDAGNSVVVIEHNLDVIKTADRIIDMGPEGGEEGGTLMADRHPRGDRRGRARPTPAASCATSRQPATRPSPQPASARHAARSPRPRSASGRTPGRRAAAGSRRCADRRGQLVARAVEPRTRRVRQRVGVNVAAARRSAARRHDAADRRQPHAGAARQPARRARPRRAARRRGASRYVPRGAASPDCRMPRRAAPAPSRAHRVRGAAREPASAASGSPPSRLAARGAGARRAGRRRATTSAASTSAAATVNAAL